MLSNFDQPVRLTPEDTEVFRQVDEIVGRSITIGDPLLAFEFGSHLRKRQAVEGLALAKLLFRLQEGWDLFRVAGIDDDMMTMVQTEMGIAPETTKKYIRMWKAIFENEGINDELKQVLMGRPIGDLLLLTAAVRDGSLENGELHQAALSPDRTALREIIRQKRGEHTSSNTAIYLTLNMVDKPSMPAGSLVARQGDEYEIIATFYPPKTDFAEKAIARIVNGVGIKEQYGG